MVETTLKKETLLDSYRRDGYLVVPGLYSLPEVKEWKQKTMARLEREGRRNDPSGVRVWMAPDLDDISKARLLDARVAENLRALVGPRVEFLSVKSVFKDGATAFGSPWHQDWFYWQGSPKISVWIALDDAGRDNGCLRVIPGSHDQVFPMEEVADAKGFVKRIPDSVLADKTEVDVELKAGDGLFFHDLLLHASHPNISGADRWSMIATYRNAGIPDKSEVWKSALPL